jgi:nitroreductase
MLNQWLMRLLQLKALPKPSWPAKKPGMTKLNDQSSLLDFLKTRKSASAKSMAGPGPDAGQLADILSIAVRVPDHGKLSPWRFVVFDDDARIRVGELFAKRYSALHPDFPAESLEFQKKLFSRAPVVVAVVSTAAEHVKIPIWEQLMSSAAVCFNMVLAAQAHGYDAQWQSDWVAYDEGAKAAMGITSHEKVAGLIYIGTSTVALEDRPRPHVQALTTHWGA